MIGKHFHIYGVQITQKFILQARKSKVDIFTRVPQAKLSQVLLITSKSEENYTFPIPKQSFGQNLFSPR